MTLDQIAKLVARLKRAGCANRPEGSAVDFARDWAPLFAGLSPADLDAVAEAHLGSADAGWWPKEHQLRGYAEAIRARTEAAKGSPTGCPDCYPTPGYRETAIGWRDKAGEEHRVVRIALCGCGAGQALHARSVAQADKGATQRISYAAQRERWFARIDERGWTRVGWWVTSRELPKLPDEARWTPVEVDRMREWGSRRRRPTVAGFVGPAESSITARMREMSRRGEERYGTDEEREDAWA